MLPDLQQSGPATTKTPAAPDAPVVPGAQFNVSPTKSAGDLASMTYKQLKARFDELQNQRQILADRRSNVASQYRSAAGISRDGIGARLQVMDRSMIQIETDLAATSQALVNKAEPSIPVPPPPNLRRGVSPGDVFGISLMVFLATMVIMVPLAVRRAKARWMRSGAPMNTPSPLETIAWTESSTPWIRSRSRSSAFRRISGS